ncbi:hypothetical protein CLOM_g11478 [Closterium sp. NIES-68]|nr:hypothetical protein CLOM_g11478 [Closterium sp. NIES-68]
MPRYHFRACHAKTLLASSKAFPPAARALPRFPTLPHSLFSAPPTASACIRLPDFPHSSCHCFPASP